MEETLQEELVERIHSGVEGADDDEEIIVTQSAIDMMKKIREDNEVPDEFLIRLGTQGGGCHGMNYIIGFDNNINENDVVIDKIRNLKLLVDRKSLFYLMGVTLDYVSNEEGSGFVFTSPHNANTCGCNHDH
jgi:iron-sulfur cluster assembly protein